MENNFTKGKKRKVCLLDLDTTLYAGDTGYVIADLCIYFKERGMFNYPCNDMPKIIRDMIRNATDRTKFAKELINFYYTGLNDHKGEGGHIDAKGPNFKTVKQNISEFWQIRGKNVWFAHAKPLIDLMHGHGYETIVISGSPREALEEAKKKKLLDYKQLYATHPDKKRKPYQCSDSNERATESAKNWVVSILKEDHDFDRNKSFAFGDSESDIPLLSAVNRANAFFVCHTKSPLEKVGETEKDLKDKKSKTRERFQKKGWNFVFVEAKKDDFKEENEIITKVKDRLKEIEK